MKIFPLLFEQMLQEEEVRREEGKGKEKLLLICQTCGRIVVSFNSLYLPHIYCHAKLIITFLRKEFLFYQR